MDDPPRRWSDQRIEQMVGKLLRAGVVASAAIVAVGAVLFLAQQGSSRPHYERFQGEPARLRTLPEIVAGIQAFDGPTVIQFGILVLLATPVARVILSVFAFALQRDWLYILITLIVLAVLLFSILGFST
jgi:uncharacterized membrane protein